MAFRIVIVVWRLLNRSRNLGSSLEAGHDHERGRRKWVGKWRKKLQRFKKGREKNYIFSTKWGEGWGQFASKAILHKYINKEEKNIWSKFLKNRNDDYVKCFISEALLSAMKIAYIQNYRLVQSREHIYLSSQEQKYKLVMGAVKIARTNDHWHVRNRIHISTRKKIYILP